MAIMPMPAAQAAADSDIATITMLAAMAALESPPQRCPKHTRPNRNAAYAHEVAHQKEEGNRHERDAGDLSKHALRH